MRTSNFMALAGAALLLGCNHAGGSSGGGKVELKTDEDKTFYALGLFEAQRVAPFAMNAKELEEMKAGLTDGVLGNKPQVDLQQFQPKLQALFETRRKQATEKQKEKSKAYLEEAAKQPGAVKLPDGLVYTIEKDGTGAMPTASDTVKVNYEGKLVDGTVFDSSYKRGQPAEFPLNGVVKCWTEGLQHVKVGGKIKLVCPSDIAYGEFGHPPTIPGGATLIFTVELLDIVPKAAPPAPTAAPPQPIK